MKTNSIHFRLHKQQNPIVGIVAEQKQRQLNTKQLNIKKLMENYKPHVFGQQNLRLQLKQTIYDNYQNLPQLRSHSVISQAKSRIGKEFQTKQIKTGILQRLVYDDGVQSQMHGKQNVVIG